MALTDLTRRGFLKGATGTGFVAATTGPASILQELVRIPLPSAAEINESYAWLCEQMHNATYGGGMFPKKVLGHVEVLSRYIDQTDTKNPLSGTLNALKSINDEWLDTDWDSKGNELAGDLVDGLNFSSKILKQPYVYEKCFALRQEVYAAGRALAIETPEPAEALEAVEEAPRPVATMIAEEEQGPISIARQTFSTATSALNKTEDVIEIEIKEEPSEAPLPVPEERHLTI